MRPDNMPRPYPPESGGDWMDVATVCQVLQPLFDLGDFHDLNGPSGFRLAAMIAPRSAADLTVRELLDMLARIEAQS